MKTLNIYYESPEQLTQFVQNHHLTNEKNLLIQAFSGVLDKDFIEKMIAEINTLLPHAILMGTTTSGEIKDGSVTEKTMVLSFSIFQNTQIESVLIPCENNEYFELGKNLTKRLTKPNTKAIILFSEGLNTDAGTLLRGIESQNPNLPIAGGAAGDNWTLTGTFIFGNQGIANSGIVATALHSDVLQVSNHSHLSFQTIGKDFTITKSENNIIYTLDNQPTAQVIEHYLGKNVVREVPMSLWEFPLIFEKNNLQIARIPLTINQDGSITFCGHFTQDDKVKFGYGHLNMILENTDLMIREIKKLPVESIFVYSCVTRRSFLGNSADAELKPLNTIAPNAGFYTYGEFFHSNACSNEVLNETTTLFLLSESTAIQSNTDDNTHSKLHFGDAFENKQIRLISTITHLVEKVTSELVDANNNVQLKNAELSEAYEELSVLLEHVNEQKQIIEKKNLSILDSIHYAKRMQTAILPDWELVQNYLPKSFVFYRPKDIISGDFYWFDETDNILFIAAVDCTGHGVPGAFMSIIGFNGLNKIVNELKITNPATILSELDKQVQQTLKQKVGSDTSKDGMDLNILAFNNITKEITFAGANRPLFAILNGKFVEYKGDKYPIGDPRYPTKNFNSYTLPMNKGDRFYLFSDGFVDQFGGDSKRKYTPNKLKELLLQLQPFPMHEQQKHITAEFDAWIGSLHQLDDVTLIGIEV